MSLHNSSSVNILSLPILISTFWQTFRISRRLYVPGVSGKNGGDYDSFLYQFSDSMLHIVVAILLARMVRAESLSMDQSLMMVCLKSVSLNLQLEIQIWSNCSCSYQKISSSNTRVLVHFPWQTLVQTVSRKRVFYDKSSHSISRNYLFPVEQ